MAEIVITLDNGTTYRMRTSDEKARWFIDRMYEKADGPCSTGLSAGFTVMTWPGKNGNCVMRFTRMR